MACGARIRNIRRFANDLSSRDLMAASALVPFAYIPQISNATPAWNTERMPVISISAAEYQNDF
jgi:hypothetical protein